MDETIMDISDYNYCLEEIMSLSDNAFSIFIGAGLSKPCGMPDWKTLVKPYAEMLGIKASELPYPRILQYSLDKKAEYNFFRNRLKQSAEGCHPKEAHRLIARLNLPRIWTTNYDGLIEQAYTDERIPYQIVAKDEDIFDLDHRSNQIIKMHGSLTKECNTDIVLLESEYENYFYGRKGIYQLLQNDIKTKSILYFGFSFDDPNLRNIVSAVWNQRDYGHPSFLFIVPPKGKSKELLYGCWKNDLARYNIKIVELNDYEEINVFLYKLLEKRFGKTIVLLGKREDTKFNVLSKRIGYKLAEAGYKIHSGGGPNIATSVAAGAWEFLESKCIPIEDKVVFFYRYGGGSTNPQKGQILYCGEKRTDIRMRMISPDKICLLIGDEPLSENGIAEEISIAQKKGVRIIPIGCSGLLAKRQWELEKSNYDIKGAFSEKRSTFEILNSTTATEDQISDAVVELADYLLVRKYE